MTVERNCGGAVGRNDGEFVARASVVERLEGAVDASFRSLVLVA